MPSRPPSPRSSSEAAARSLSRRAAPWEEGGVADPVFDTSEEDARPGAPSSAQSYERFLSVFSRTSGLLGTLESLFVQLEGVPSTRLAEHLWQRHRIFTVAIEHEEFEGIRVSPSVYSTLEEVDRFAEAMERVLRDGLPAA